MLTLDREKAKLGLVYGTHVEYQSPPYVRDNLASVAVVSAECSGFEPSRRATADYLRSCGAAGPRWTNSASLTWA